MYLADIIQECHLNYYENVVIDYLRADRAIFVNTEYCIQTKPGSNPDKLGPHWYCDAVALDFSTNQILLCEISYAEKLSALTKRLMQWNEHWGDIRKAVLRDSLLPESWKMSVLLFVPESRRRLLNQRLAAIEKANPLKFAYEVKHLEEVHPWLYKSWNRIDRSGKDSPDPIAE